MRCAVCRYVFRVEPRDDSGARPWLIQTVDGDAFEADDLTVLRVWVREGRLHPDDTISRTGKHWIRLGDMPEFSDAFAGFPDLPAVLSPTDAGPLDATASDVSQVGPPPSYAGDDVPTAVADAAVPMVRETSQRLDLSGLLATPDDTEDTVARAPGSLSLETTETSTLYTPAQEVPDVIDVDEEPEPGAPRRRSMFDEDSASMVLDDLVRPAEETPAPARPETKRRKPKHQTTKVRTVAAVAEANADESGVLRVLDGEPEADAPIPVRADEGTSGRSAGPKPAASSGSMLGAVTAHVKPITGPSRTVPAAPPASSEPSLLADEDLEPPTRRRASWPLFAGLGLLCGAAVIFGIPPIRDRVMGMAGFVAGTPSDASAPALQTVDAALRDGRQAGLSAAATEARTAATAPGTTPQAKANLSLAAVEADAARAIAMQVQAAHAGTESDLGFRAADTVEAAAQAFAGIDVAQADAQRLSRTRARLRLAQGRPQDEVLPQVPAAEVELHALATGASLWRDPNSRVPSGLISSLGGLESPSVTAQLVLAMAYARGGDEVGAQRVAAALRERAPEDPGVLALGGGADASPTPDAEPAETPKAPTTPSPEEPTPAEPADPEGEAPDVAATPGGGKTQGKPAGGKDASKGMSVDKLIEKGCGKVEGGDVQGGLKLLLRAFDRRPNDIDVLVCLGMANRKKGVPTTALRYYERALSRSPRYLPALLGAARASTKLGEGDKALGFYKRVLSVSPGNAEAKSYVAKKSGAKKAAPPSSKPEPAGSGDAPARKPEPPAPPN